MRPQNVKEKEARSPGQEGRILDVLEMLQVLQGIVGRLPCRLPMEEEEAVKSTECCGDVEAVSAVLVMAEIEKTVAAPPGCPRKTASKTSSVRGMLLH